MNSTILKSVNPYQIETTDSEKRLLVISKFAQDLINLSSSKELMHYVTQEVVAQTGFVDCVIYLLDKDRDILIQKSAYGEKNDADNNILNAIEIKLGEGISGYVAITGTPLIIGDTTVDERHINDLGAGNSEICVPITYDGNIMGVIDSEHPEKNFFTEEHLSFLTTVASMLGGRLQEWRLLEELNKSRVELKAAVDIAEKSNKIKSEFLASMSHDLRTPLNAIIGFSEMMKAEIFGKINNDRYAGYVSDINNSSQYLLGLVNDILDLSALEANERVLTYGDHDLETLLGQCRDLTYKLAEQKELTFTVSAEKDLPPLFADEHAIMQIVMNLVSNAIKFTPEGGSVTLGAALMNEGHIIIVSDTGIGISEDFLQNAPKPFSRETDGPFYKDKEGSGLGLAIVNSLVSLHGGDIMIESKRHVGTTIKVVLPFKMQTSINF